tara:strand:- start:7182 stop:8264 length:1083 start_codon:yes stop_codon:yes gene_type:complete
MRYLFLIFTALLSLNLSAQNSQGEADDAGRIAICPVIGNIPDMPEAAEKILLTKMAQITTKNGLGSYGNRFIMYPKVHIMSKDITPTAPTMHVYNLSVTMYIADNVTQTIFASTSIELQGVGKNPTKAYIGALKGLNYNRPEVKNFVEEGKNRIIEYYNSQCDFILKDADSAAGRKEFDKAIYSLISIPKVCKECYLIAQDVSITIYKLKMENECMENIAQAKGAKAQNNWDLAASYLVSILPDVSCYVEAKSLLEEIENHKCAAALGKAKGAWAMQNEKEAGRWLGEVASDSKCYDEAVALGNEIKEKLKSDENREWNFKLKVQQDQLDLEKKSIQAARDIGIAFIENQQPINIHWINN